MFEFRPARMRAGRLVRRVPLRRRTPVRQGPPPSAPSGSRPVPGINQLTRETVLERDGHCCVACGRGGYLQLHHRRPVGRGGSRNPRVHAVVNLVAACEPCHDGIHANPQLARQLGLLVARNADPHLIPVFTAARGLVFLTGDGWFLDVADVEPEGLLAAMGWDLHLVPRGCVPHAIETDDNGRFTYIGGVNGEIEWAINAPRGHLEISPDESGECSLRWVEPE